MCNGAEWCKDVGIHYGINKGWIPHIQHIYGNFTVVQVCTTKTIYSSFSSAAGIGDVLVKAKYE